MDFPGHFQHIFKQLNHQRLHAQLCDCVVVVGGQTFQAHRSILAACSSHFRALLNSSEELEGSGDGRGGDHGPSVMTLDPGVVTPEAFSTLLDMIYTSTLSLGASNVMDVLLAASHLHLNTVVKACKLHLSRKNFPASPPKGWRSVQHQHQQQSVSTQAAASSQQQVIVVDLEKEEVSQSGGDGEEDSEVSRGVGGEQSASTSVRYKRKSEEDRLSDRKRSSRVSGENYKECSPTVTRSTVSAEEGDLLSPDCLKTIDSLWGNQGEEEAEEKYEAKKGDSDEVQLPSQSDSSMGGAGVWERNENTNEGIVVKIKVGEEEVEEPKMGLIEVKKENTSLLYSDLDTMPKQSPPSPLEDCTDHLDRSLDHDRMTTASPPEGDVSSLQTQLCADLHTGAQQGAAGDLGEDSVDGEGLESLSELAFSCFLNPSSESVMGALEEEDSLASLTAAAAASDIPPTPAGTCEQNQHSEEANGSSAQASESSSSLVFPVTSVPLQQILPEQNPNFSDTIILQPAQNPLAGFLSGIRPGLGFETPLIQPTKARKGSGATTFRRIAPKVPPGSETSTDHSSGPAGDATDRPPLTRASEDVLSKCKKAAAEDHVLLVEGEKKYACKICCKTFMNLTDCKKHIRVHTGEKPYPCPKCGKRFSQSSHLYKHSKNTCLNWKDDQSFPDTLL